MVREVALDVEHNDAVVVAVAAGGVGVLVVVAHIQVQVVLERT